MDVELEMEEVDSCVVDVVSKLVELNTDEDDVGSVDVVDSSVAVVELISEEVEEEEVDDDTAADVDTAPPHPKQSIS